MTAATITSTSSPAAARKEKMIPACAYPLISLMHNLIIVISTRMH